LALSFSRRILEMLSTTKVMKNRIRARYSSEAWCRPAPASANSLARVEVIELAASKSDSEDSWFMLPITKVTAMVSPRARPRPSMTPPTTPVLV
jgi:hypothetical protein